ncbi:MAG: hypothetical protein RI987_649 [Actinomycetota bacterium]|jgi:apolipoprotein N-acyltransferase
MVKRLALAVAGGFASSLAMPREDLWPLIFVSVAALSLSVRGLKAWSALFVGFAGGLAFYLSQIEWLTLYLGPVPWLALSTLEAIIFALGLLALSVVWRWLDARDFGRFGSLIIAAALASIWTAREWVSITLPYGGFPWSRLAQTQSNSYLSKWVFVGGLGWLTFVIAFVSIAALLLLLNRETKIAKAALGASIVLFLIGPLAINPSAAAEAGSYRIAAVQGNANAGLFANTKRGEVLQNHIDATAEMLKDSKSQDLDVLVWPENASDLSPFSDAKTYQDIQNLVNDEYHVPFIFGTITARGDNLYNSSILWTPGLGPTDWYDKKRPVPFAEYVPDRDFWYQLAPDLIGLVSRGYTFGERDGIFEIGAVKLGALICFEIAIDDISRDLVQQGAQVILSQTNNADFGRSDETFQQAAFAKLRAIETGRSVVNISTVGVSAIYGADGSTLASLPTFESGYMIQDVPLRTSLTPAIVIGRYVDLAINLIALALILLATLPAARKRREA